MSTFDKKWSELTRQERQAAKNQWGENTKQNWQDAKARSKGFKNEQDRRGNSGERHRTNNPDSVNENSSQSTTTTTTATTNNTENTTSAANNNAANNNQQASATASTESSPAASSTNQTPTDNTAHNLHTRLGLNTDKNASYEDTIGKYQNIYRNARAHGVALTDLYAKAGLKNPEEYKKEWQQNPNAFRSKYGVENFGEVMKATGHVELDNLKGSWRKPDTLDKATINLDPEAFGELGKQVNDKKYQQNFDFSTPAPIQVNALGGKAYGAEKNKLEKQYGVSLNQYNRSINPNDDTNYNHSPSQRQGHMDYFIDTIANKYNEPWAFRRAELRGDNYEYGKGYYEQVQKGGLPGGKAPLQKSGREMLNLNFDFDPNRFNQGQ